MTAIKCEARTMVELKPKIRKAMGWPDRRSWTPEEYAILKQRFNIRVDFKRGVIVAAERKAQP